MIRLRDTKGQAHELPADVRFVEICDLRGSVAKLLWRDEAGVVNVVDAGSPQAKRYAQMMRVDFIPVTPTST